MELQYVWVQERYLGELYAPQYGRDWVARVAPDTMVTGIVYWREDELKDVPKQVRGCACGARGVKGRRQIDRYGHTA